MLVNLILEGRMGDEQQQRNHTASLRYINSLNAEMHSTGELKYSFTRGGFTMFHPPPKTNNRKPGELRFPLRAWTYYHPPPVQSPRCKTKNLHGKNEDDDSSRTRGSCGFINKTNPKTRIRETLNAFPRSKRLETVRSI